MTERYDDPVVALWRRLDTPGHEVCRFLHDFEGRSLEGTAVFAHEGQTCELTYGVYCDDDAWRSVSALVRGWIGHDKFRHVVQWTAADDRWRK